MSSYTYLYSLLTPEPSEKDEKCSIVELSHWRYDIPFLWKILMSGNPKICNVKSLQDFTPDDQIPVIVSPGDIGLQRAKRFIRLVNILLESDSHGTLSDDLFKGETKDIFGWLKITEYFLEANKTPFYMLDISEVVAMLESDPNSIYDCVYNEAECCRYVGDAIAALPVDDLQAAALLKKAVSTSSEVPFDAFFGLRLDDDCDLNDLTSTNVPLGLVWNDEAVDEKNCNFFIKLSSLMFNKLKRFIWLCK